MAGEHRWEISSQNPTPNRRSFLGFKITTNVISQLKVRSVCSPPMFWSPFFSQESVDTELLWNISSQSRVTFRGSHRAQWILRISSKHLDAVLQALHAVPRPADPAMLNARLETFDSYSSRYIEKLGPSAIIRKELLNPKVVVITLGNLYGKCQICSLWLFSTYRKYWKVP